MKTYWPNLKFAAPWLVLAILFLWLASFSLSHFGYWWKYILSIYAFIQYVIFGTLGLCAIILLED